MNRTQITEKELNKAVRKFKVKLMRGKKIAFSMLIGLAVSMLICGILKILGITGEESVTTAALYWVFGGIAVVCIYPGIYGLIRLPYIIKFFKKIKQYQRNDLIRDMVFDLETSATVRFGDKAFLTDKYLFTKNFKKLPIPCNEIYWVYITTFKGYGSIKLGTKNHGIVSYSGVETHNRMKDAILDQVVSELQKRTDRELLLDYSVENEKQYKQMVCR